MIGIFVRAVIFGLGVELGREIYKTAKSKLKERTLPGRKEAPEPEESGEDRGGTGESNVGQPEGESSEPKDVAESEAGARETDDEDETAR